MKLGRHRCWRPIRLCCQNPFLATYRSGYMALLRQSAVLCRWKIWELSFFIDAIFGHYIVKCTNFFKKMLTFKNKSTKDSKIFKGTQPEKGKIVFYGIVRIQLPQR